MNDRYSKFQYFENSVDFSFSEKDIQEIPRCSICAAPVIIRSWCKEYFCMYHLRNITIVNISLYKNYVNINSINSKLVLIVKFNFNYL